MAKCKNCGHEMELFGGEYYHVHSDSDGDSLVSKECSYVLENAETEAFEKEEMQGIADRMKKKFGNYMFEYWFFEVKCACKNPVPENDEKCGCEYKGDEKNE